MGLSAIVEAVQTALQLDGETLVGAEALSREGKPPRIVWVPRDDTFMAPQERGATLQRSLHTRRIAADVHLWGADMTATETMLEDFVNALRAVVGPNYELLGGQWLGQTLTARGRTYVLGLAVKTPLPEAAPTRVTVTGEVTDTAFQD